jgi:anti-sigma B factor antagonist
MDRPKETNSLPRLDNFRCAVSYSGEAAEVVVCGEVDLTTAREVEREVMAALALPIKAIGVHLGRVTFLDSSGIGALLRAQRSACDRGVTFRLTSVPRGVRRVFEITGVAEALGLTAATRGAPPAEGDAAV